MKVNEIDTLRDLFEREKGAFESLTSWIRDISRFCGVSEVSAWYWWSGERKPSAAAKKLLALRPTLTKEQRKIVSEN